MAEKELQFGFMEKYANATLDRTARERKAKKVLAILEDSLVALDSPSLLDIGCSAGFMSRQYARRFNTVIAVDVDAPAIHFAARHNAAENLTYIEMDSQRLAFPDASFDAVTCTHIYEHVPDPTALMQEIYRVLKPGGVCFFSAGNRFSLMEPHYRLPLLSVFPKPLAHLYLKLLGRGSFYYETHLSYWGLKKLVRSFEVRDYTLDVIKQPVKYHAEDLIAPASMKQKCILLFLRFAYWLCPTYLWVLRKLPG